MGDRETLAPGLTDTDVDGDSGVVLAEERFQFFVGVMLRGAEHGPFVDGAVLIEVGEEQFTIGELLFRGFFEFGGVEVGMEGTHASDRGGEVEVRRFEVAVDEAAVDVDLEFGGRIPTQLDAGFGEHCFGFLVACLRQREKRAKFRKRGVKGGRPHLVKFRGLAQQTNCSVDGGGAFG